MFLPSIASTPKISFQKAAQIRSDYMNILTRMLLVLLLLPFTSAQHSLVVSGYNTQMEVYSLGGNPTNHTLTKHTAWPVDTNLTWLQLPASGWLEAGDSLYASNKVNFFVPGMDPGSPGAPLA